MPNQSGRGAPGHAFTSHAFTRTRYPMIGSGTEPLARSSGPSLRDCITAIFPDGRVPQGRSRHFGERYEVALWNMHWAGDCQSSPKDNDHACRIHGHVLQSSCQIAISRSSAAVLHENEHPRAIMSLTFQEFHIFFMLALSRAKLG